jgi:hypothetical protein
MLPYEFTQAYKREVADMVFADLRASMMLRRLRGGTQLDVQQRPIHSSKVLITCRSLWLNA